MVHELHLAKRKVECKTLLQKIILYNMRESAIYFLQHFHEGKKEMRSKLLLIISINF